VKKVHHIKIATEQSILLKLIDTYFLITKWEIYIGRDSTSEFRGMSVFSNKIYILYDSATTEFGATSVDFILSVIDQSTGLEVETKIFGSTSDDQGIDIVANHFGIFILADIGDGFKDSALANSYSTQNSNLNFAMLLLNHDTEIQEIESYDTSDVANNLGAPYPKKLIFGRRNKHDPLFAFISTRDNEDSNQGGGVYLTQPADQGALFVTGNSVGT
jgi:hypothetical protein